MGTKKRLPADILPLSETALFRNVRVALVHDWLTGMRGGEKVLEVLCELFPNAPLYTLIHNPGSMSPTIAAMDIRTSFLDTFPLKERKYRNYLPLMPKAIESFDLSEYDLIISTSHAVAKGAQPAQNALHVCYCFTPMRYVWDQYDEYFGKGKAGLITRMAMKGVARYLRAWDRRTSNRVHHFIADSANVAGRIERFYDRQAEVLCAPVDTKLFSLSRGDDGYFLIVSALVPYKKVELAIEAFKQIGAPLIIAGTGPEREHLEAIAGENITFLGWQTDEQLSRLYARCTALIFPGEEDFGIVPLEAMASGKPVIAFGKGGALETVVGKGPGRTGVFFKDQTTPALIEAVKVLQRTTFSPDRIRTHAELFSREVFKKRFAEKIARFFEKHLRGR